MSRSTARTQFLRDIRGALLIHGFQERVFLRFLLNHGILKTRSQ